MVISNLFYIFFVAICLSLIFMLNKCLIRIYIYVFIFNVLFRFQSRLVNMIHICGTDETDNFVNKYGLVDPIPILLIIC